MKGLCRFIRRRDQVDPVNLNPAIDQRMTAIKVAARHAQGEPILPHRSLRASLSGRGITADCVGSWQGHCRPCDSAKASARRNSMRDGESRTELRCGSRDVGSKKRQRLLRFERSLLNGLFDQLFRGTTAHASISTSISLRSMPTPRSKVAGRGCARRSGSNSSKNRYISSRMSNTSSRRGR